MTNLTKQEIQEYRGVISMLIDVRQGDKMLEKVLSVSLKALDIAEKQVWCPISEAPKDGTGILVCFPKGAVHVVRWDKTHREDVPECWVFTDTTDSCSFEFETPTHYMPLPPRV